MENLIIPGRKLIVRICQTRKTRRSSQAPSSTGFSKATSTPFGFSAPSEDEDVFADDGKGKSKSKGRSLKKIASMGQLREDADEALEEQREKGRGKARKSEGDVSRHVDRFVARLIYKFAFDKASAPEASRHGLPRKSSVSRTKEEEGGFSDFNPFQAVGDEPAESSKKAKELKKRRVSKSIGYRLCNWGLPTLDRTSDYRRRHDQTSRDPFSLYP